MAHAAGAMTGPNTIFTQLSLFKTMQPEPLVTSNTCKRRLRDQRLPQAWVTGVREREYYDVASAGIRFLLSRPETL